VTLEVTALAADAGLVFRLCTKFEVRRIVVLPVRMILGIYCVSISRPGDLDLDL